MKKTDLPEPQRWGDLPARTPSAENAIGSAFRRVKDLTAPSDAAVARLALRVDAPAPTVRWRLIGRLALAAALIMATGSVVGAALMRWRRAELNDPKAKDGSGPSAGNQPSKRHLVRRGPRVSGPLAPAVPAPEPVPPAPASEPPASSLPLPASPVAFAPPSLSPAGSHPAAAHATAAGPPTEAGALTDVFHQLRANGDAAAALRSLDAYDRRFPRGPLRGEARIARVEALMALDRRREALPLLEGLEAGGGALTRDLRLTRGELLAEAGRCVDARRDLDTVLAVRESDAAGGRALYARASCRLRAGEVEPARQDLRRYLLLHPNGPLAPAARRVTDALP